MFPLPEQIEGQKKSVCSPDLSSGGVNTITTEKRMSQAKFLSPRQVAKRLEISLNATYADLWTGRLPGEKRDGKWLIPIEAVEKRLRKRRPRQFVSSDLVVDRLWPETNKR